MVMIRQATGRSKLDRPIVRPVACSVDRLVADFPLQGLILFKMKRIFREDTTNIIVVAD
jgi:hypothetical protein